MRGASRHGPSRPDRTGGKAGGRAGGQAGVRHQGQPGGSAPEPAELAALLEPVATAAGLDLESVRVSMAGRRRLLRVVVDADGGVSLDDIALVSRDLSARLDASGAMGQAPYTLEVSSPGVDRPLTQPRHWRRAIGRLVAVPLAAPGAAPHPSHSTDAPGSAARLEGRVIGAGEDRVTLDVAGRRREFAYAELGAGRVQVEFGRPEGEPGQGEGGPAAAGGRDGGRPDGH